MLLFFLSALAQNEVAHGNTVLNFYPENTESCLQALSSGQVLSKTDVEASGSPDHYFKDQILLSAFDAKMFETRMYFKRDGSLIIYCSIAK